MKPNKLLVSITILFILVFGIVPIVTAKACTLNVRAFGKGTVTAPSGADVDATIGINAKMTPNDDGELTGFAVIALSFVLPDGTMISAKTTPVNAIITVEENICLFTIELKGHSFLPIKMVLDAKNKISGTISDAEYVVTTRSGIPITVSLNFELSIKMPLNNDCGVSLFPKT